MKFFASTLAVVALATLSSAFDICSDASTDIMTVSSVSYTPNPPKAGSPLTVNVDGTFKAAISGGTIKVSVSAGSLPVWSDSYDICKEAEANGKSCPLPAGSNSFTKTVTVPSGSYTLQAVATTTDGKSITCVKESFKI
ncbi:unnamed protein product [Cunninghamella blakesleeana]